MLTALFIGLGSIGTRHLKNLTAICAQRGLALRADALRSGLARPLRPGAAELLHSQFTTLLFYIGNRRQILCIDCPPGNACIPLFHSNGLGTQFRTTFCKAFLDISQSGNCGLGR